MLSIGTEIQLEVKEKAKQFYWPKFLHSFIGTVWDIDEDHIWIEGQNRTIDGKAYMSGPHRYVLDDVIITEI